jgi:hypothetical protein
VKLPDIEYAPVQTSLGRRLALIWAIVRNIDPDEYARVLRVAQRTGIPPAIVADNPQAFENTSPWLKAR